MKPCPYFTLSTVKHHARCLSLKTSLCSLGEQPHKPKPSCISTLSCSIPSLGAFQGSPLQLIIIKSSAEQQGDKCLSWLVSKLLQIARSKSQKGDDATGEEQWLKKALAASQRAEVLIRAMDSQLIQTLMSPKGLRDNKSSDGYTTAQP